ncbi:MAG: polysaccharide deacetylase family protein [Magnetococcales bacterium]|nr:polysaccharide deacetylase family protein [Magnetococcales bacterium]
MDAFFNRMVQRLYRRFPSMARRRYTQLCRRLMGATPGRIFLLSFDCDNPEDLPALTPIRALLDELRIRATFAAPGEILRLDPALFASLAHEGHELMAHGDRRHSEIRAGRYVSTLYYHTLTDAELREDVTRGCEAVAALTGTPPAGFRIPHFGHSNRSGELRRVYTLLQPLGVRYSSSTLPFRALRHGPLYDAHHGLQELPISPSFTRPLTILDTFSHGFDARKPDAGHFQGYFTEFSHILRQRDWILNLYCDPSQAVRMEGWWEKALRAAVAHGFSFQTLDQFRTMANAHPPTMATR